MSVNEEDEDDEKRNMADASKLPLYSGAGTNGLGSGANGVKKTVELVNVEDNNLLLLAVLGVEAKFINNLCPNCGYGVSRLMVMG